MDGWIKLHRSIVDWEWFDDPNCLKLLIYLNASVNYQDKKWKGITVKAGSLVCSNETLSLKVGMSIKQLRTSLSKLIKSGEVSKKATNKYTVVTLVKWEQMQSDSSQEGKQKASKGQSKGKPRATTKERKEREEREERKEKEFDLFWDLYNKKRGRTKCLNKFKKLKDNEVSLILDKVKDYVISTPDVQYRKDPFTWLNGEHWNDEMKNKKKSITYNANSF